MIWEIGFLLGQTDRGQEGLAALDFPTDLFSWNVGDRNVHSCPGLWATLKHGF